MEDEVGIGSGPLGPSYNSPTATSLASLAHSIHVATTTAGLQIGFSTALPNAGGDCRRLGVIVPLGASRLV